MNKYYLLIDLKDMKVYRWLGKLPYKCIPLSRLNNHIYTDKGDLKRKFWALQRYKK